MEGSSIRSPGKIVTDDDAPRVREQTAPSVANVLLTSIDRNPRQPRQTFSDSSLRALAASLAKHSILQPILLRPGAQEGRYEIVVGERRWRAAQLAGWDAIPAIVRSLTDRAAAELALVENEQREAVRTIETIRAMHRLVEDHGYTHEDLALALGVERPSVTHMLRLLKLDPQVQELIGDGEHELSSGHARALVSLTKGQQRTLAARCIRERLSVRDLEQLVKRLTSANGPLATSQPTKEDPNVRQAEEQLQLTLGQPVQIRWSSKEGRGAVEIKFHSLDELDGFLDRVGSLRPHG
jgi:ParB family transcriptional regulator, chromosome partitioning protein